MLDECPNPNPNPNPNLGVELECDSGSHECTNSRRPTLDRNVDPFGPNITRPLANEHPLGVSPVSALLAVLIVISAFELDLSLQGSRVDVLVL